MTTPLGFRHAIAETVKEQCLRMRGIS